eukprot:1178493-Prorocentrum_minimum.AAC.5
MGRGSGGDRRGPEGGSEGSGGVRKGVWRGPEGSVRGSGGAHRAMRGRRRRARRGAGIWRG